MSDLEITDLGQLTANGSTTAHQVESKEVNPTGHVNIRSTGDFDGGTLTYEGSQNGSDWYDIGLSGILVEAGGVEAKLLVGEYVRATLEGATSPTVDTFILLAGTASL